MIVTSGFVNNIMDRFSKHFKLKFIIEIVRKDVCSVSLSDDFEEIGYQEEEKLGWTV